MEADRSRCKATRRSTMRCSRCPEHCQLMQSLYAHVDGFSACSSRHLPATMIRKIPKAEKDNGTGEGSSSFLSFRLFVEYDQD